jgi:hypothetical protein
VKGESPKRKLTLKDKLIQVGEAFRCMLEAGHPDNVLCNGRYLRQVMSTGRCCWTLRWERREWSFVNPGQRKSEPQCEV